MKRIVFALLLLAGSCIWVNAQQVGVNTDNPNPLAVLDITNVSSGADSVSLRGVMVPRMTEAERNRINVLNPNNANGLFVYNTDEDCFNYYSRIHARWKSLCGDENGIAEISAVYCDSTRVIGDTLIVGTALSNDVYIELTANVTKAGNYQFSAIPTNGNGYYFSSSGIFFLPGLTSVRLTGMGTPLNEASEQSPDSLYIYANGDFVCSINITVAPREDNTPVFSINCDNPSINGNYIAGSLLSTSYNTVQVTLTTNNDQFSKIYQITTDTVNGYYFAGSGVITANSQLVTLYGYGAPETMGTDTYTLYTNSEVASGSPTNPACPFNVRVAARKMRILGVGENATYYLGSTNNGMNKLINNTALFGLAPDSLVQLVDGFEIITPGATNNVNMATAINNYNPDIIIIQYDWTGNGTSTSTASIDSLVNFVNNKGGVLILCSDGGWSGGGLRDRSPICQNIVRRIFDNNTALTAGAAATGPNTQPFATGVVNPAPVLNGRYNLEGRSMARDADYNFGFTNIQDISTLQVIAWENSPTNTSARAFMHANKGFVFIGDGAPFAYQAGNTDPNNYPMKLTNDYFPTTGISGTTVTYNAHLFCNIMAWAIEYAQRNRP